jgi:hypothetical protein
MVEFEPPPPIRSGRRNPHWDNVVAQLKEHPGEWALVGNYSPGMAAHIRKGTYPAFIPEGTKDAAAYMKKHWAITSRKTGEGRNDLFIRYLGG